MHIGINRNYLSFTSCNFYYDTLIVMFPLLQPTSDRFYATVHNRRHAPQYINQFDSLFSIKPRGNNQQVNITPLMQLPRA